MTVIISVVNYRDRGGGGGGGGGRFSQSKLPSQASICTFKMKSTEVLNPWRDFITRALVCNIDTYAYILCVYVHRLHACVHIIYTHALTLHVCNRKVVYGNCTCDIIADLPQ